MLSVSVDLQGYRKRSLPRKSRRRRQHPAQTSVGRERNLGGRLSVTSVYSTISASVLELQSTGWK
jgi:hypothetical protein